MVDTSNWLGGKWVGVSPESVASIDWGNQVVNVNLTRNEIKWSDDEEANVPSHEMTPGFVII